jgi:hypothetical protein
MNALKWALFAIAIAAPSNAARADALDEAASDAARALAGEFKKAGYKSVGVLKFEVQKGADAKNTYMAAGRMNELMATRLENALLRVMSYQYKKDPISITRGASEFAAKADAKSTYHSEAGRKALFAHTYPMIWGAAQKVDAFVSGRVVLSNDRSKITAIRYFVFDTKDLNLRPCQYETASIAMTRSMLSDLGYSFISTKSGLVARDMGDTIDEVKLPNLNNKTVNEPPMPMPMKEPKPVDTTKPDEPKPSIDDTPNPTTLPKDETKLAITGAELVDFTVLYDGAPAQVQEDGATLPTPAEGQFITITMTARERVAVLLTVNGQNTVDSEPLKTEAHLASKWVLEPGKLYTIQGFHQNNAKLLFKAANPDEAMKTFISTELAASNKLGQIEFTVFREQKAVQAAGFTTPKIDTTVNNAAYKGIAPTLDTAAKDQEKLTQSIVTKSLIIGADASVHQLEKDDITIDPTPAQNKKLTYFKMPPASPVTGTISP